MTHPTDAGYQWGAVGFNTAYKMIGTEVMWLGVEDGAASLKYKQATATAQPGDLADQPQAAEAANTAAGLQARWTRPLTQGDLMVLEADTSNIQLIVAWKAGVYCTRWFLALCYQTRVRGILHRRNLYALC